MTTIRRRLSLGFGFLVIVLLLTVVTSVVGAYRTAENDQRSEVFQSWILDATTTRAAVRQHILDHFLGIGEGGEDAARHQLSVEHVKAALARLNELGELNCKKRKICAHTEVDMDAVTNAWGGLHEKLRQSHSISNPAERVRSLRDTFDRNFEGDFAPAIARIIEVEKSAEDARMKIATGQLFWFRSANWALLFIATGFSLLFVVVESRQIASRLERLAAVARSVAAGKRDPILADGGNDEIGSLSVALVIMVDSLRARENEVSALDAQLLHTAKLASLGTVGAGIAHEINNPLTVATGFMHSIRKQMEKPQVDKAKVESYVQRITIALERIGGIVNHVRRFSDGERESKRGPVSLNESVSNSLVFMEKQLNGRNIEVETIGDSRSPQVVGHAISLESVVQNLVINARDALGDVKDDRQKKIKIQTEVSELRNIVTLIVSDNAGGIPATIRSRVFDPFFTTKEPGKGTGLGLSIVHRIVADHGGVISFVSHEGAGTTFTVELPLYRLPVTAMAS